MRLVTVFTKHDKVFDLDKTLFLPPAKIVYSALSEFDFQHFKGVVLSGDWDRLEKRFEETDVYVALKEVLIEGKGWKKTIYFQRLLDAVKKGEPPYFCVDENDINQRCRNLEALFYAIKDHGYKTQRELIKSRKFADHLAIDDEVTVSVGRYGDFLFSDGVHRLAIAKILGIPQIPVKIAVRHTEWMKFASELLQYAKAQGGRLYQPAAHPDLADIPAFHNCEDRFLMIKENISVRKGQLLDIGANLGYFCHAFENEGFECYAVEEAPEELYFLRKLRRAGNRKFAVVAENVYDWSQFRLIHFDVVLALNVFHHALRTEQSYYKLVDLLHNSHMGELFIELPTQEEMEGAHFRDFYKKYTPREFLNFMIEASRLKKAELIGKAGDGREIYKLS